MNKRLTVNVDLDVTGEDAFIDLLGAIVGEKKSLSFLKDISIWEYDPETTVKTVTVRADE